MTNIFLSSLLIAFLVAGNAMDLGKEITVNDGIASRGSQLGPYGEDDEVEHSKCTRKQLGPSGDVLER
jgi:hypothetical protein